MTENEIIEMLEIEKSYMDSHAGRSQSEALAYAIEAVKEIQQYRAIGTVEECNKYKQSCLIVTVTFDENQLKRIVDEKLEEYELDIQKIRAKAIDDFFEELQKYEEDDMWLRLKMSSVYEIAEQIKAGGK